MFFSNVQSIHNNIACLEEKVQEKDPRKATSKLSRESRSNKLYPSFSLELEAESSASVLNREHLIS
jgi:hypothetical protein